MPIVADAAIALRADLSKYRSDLQGAQRETEQTGSRLSRALSPSNLFAGMGAAAGAAAIPILKIGDAYKEATDAIRVGTGATGEQLRILEGDFKAVAGRVPQDLGTVGEVVADLNTRLGLQGEALQDASKQVLDFARVWDVDAASASRTATRLLNAMDLSAAELPVTLDKLTLASQMSGAGVLDLATWVTEAGPAFEELGFGMDKSLALFARFEREGAKPQEVLGSLNIAMTRLAREGFTDAEAAFTELLREIEEAPDLLSATEIAADAFGSRVGAKVADDIRNGRFEVEEWREAIAGAGGETASAADDIQSMGDHLAAFKNRVATALGPVAQNFAGVAQAMGPMLYSLPLLGGAIGKTVGLAFEGLGGLATRLVPMLGGAFAAAGSAIGGVFTAAASLVIAAWPLILLALVVAAIALLLSNPEIREKALEVGAAIVGAIGDALAAIGEVLGGIVGAAIEAGAGVVRAIGDAVGTAVEFITGIPGRVAAWVGEMVSGALEAGAGVVAAIADGAGKVVGFITGIPGRIVAWVAGIVGQAGEAASGAASHVASAAGEVVGTILGIPGRAIGWVGDLIRQAIRAQLEFVAKIVGLAGDVVREILAIPGKAIGFVGGLVGVAADAVAGFIGQIARIPGAVADIVGGAVRNIGSFARDAWSNVTGFVGGLIPSFQSGTPYAPEGLAYLHEGEIVIPPALSESLRALVAGGGAAPIQRNVNIEINNPRPETAGTSARREANLLSALGVFG